ncbi:MBL fold metallo-hydrolase [Proteus myxofaciens]|uniref:Metal dependent hydrolase n=1 Tax=Proteus myxofaciens ATCC 19692 TaxID=1354337 RepID=A0A198GHY2_9GAMM|nr:MBL fold metallo-hydrolase [Proteus myxofaciens]OAT37057.1 metal dependent hydrolase [Proteus myxofaciens ATCC 19692]
MLTITALLENDTINSTLNTYPGLSLLLEDTESQTKILFDTGKDKTFIQNAQKMGIDLTVVETIIISHGHYDHFGGLTQIPENYFIHKPQVIAHPHLFSIRYSALFCGQKNIKFKRLAPIFNKASLEAQFFFKLTDIPYSIDNRFIYSGQVNERIVNKRYGVIVSDSGEIDDYVLDDSFVVWRGKKGLVIITGCSHSGIESIIQYAKKITGDSHIQAIIGGLHLRCATPSALQRAKKAIESHVDVYGCHCTGLLGRKYLNAKTFNTGQSLTFD